MSSVLGTLLSALLFGGVMAWVLRPLNPADTGPEGGSAPTADSEVES